MFSTLRHSNSADEPYILEPAFPPFDPKRKLVRSACKSCRSSKLKCTGEENGCQRCLAKNIDCVYPVNTGSHARKQSTEVRKAAAQSKKNGGTTEPKDTRGARSRRNSPDKTQDYNFSDMIVDFDETQSFDVNLEPSRSSSISEDVFSFQTGRTPRSTDLPDDFPTKPFYGSLYDLDLMSPMSPALGTAFHGTGSEFPDSETRHPSIDDFANITDFGTAPFEEYSISSNSETTCSCTKQAATIYESVEVHLVWGPRETGDANVSEKILQHQKKALAQCEKILRCPQCISRSEVVMLVASTCERIMGSLENMFAEPSEGDNFGWIGTSSGGLDPHQGSTAGTDLTNGIVEEDRVLFEQIDSGNIGAGSDLDGRRRVRIGRWQLDDEDELHVLQSLLAARMTKLDRLIGQLEAAIKGNYWPAHKGLIRSLRQRFARASVFNKIVESR
ncbi:hypothetical protein F4805DRAFT_338639 [Annulohypoxylon moriforme]|nr:hypothetical protein F4805DRAFT_338639 [Annulohypoxylon moriforme]